MVALGGGLSGRTLTRCPLLVFVGLLVADKWRLGQQTELHNRTFVDTSDYRRLLG
jgi:hypothetical protein